MRVAKDRLLDQTANAKGHLTVADRVIGHEIAAASEVENEEQAGSLSRLLAAKNIAGHGNIHPQCHMKKADDLPRLAVD
jgi:hypothetical protein